MFDIVQEQAVHTRKNRAHRDECRLRVLQRIEACPEARARVRPTPRRVAAVENPWLRPLPWAGGLRFYAQETATLTFRRANGDNGPVTELRRDDMSNHYILEKQ